MTMPGNFHKPPLRYGPSRYRHAMPVRKRVRRRLYTWLQPNLITIVICIVSSASLLLLATPLIARTSLDPAPSLRQKFTAILPWSNVLAPLDLTQAENIDSDFPLALFRKSKDSRRIIVLGDSWSDNGYDPGSSSLPSSLNLRARSGLDFPGKVWTNWLCGAIACTRHDNFAVSAERWPELEPTGAVIDFDILNSTLSNRGAFNGTATLPGDRAGPASLDMKEQVRRWLDYEQSKLKSGKAPMQTESTVFVVWFSLWDMWYLSSGNLLAADNAVKLLASVFFAQLDLIAENWPYRPKIIIPEAIDLTYLPTWNERRTSPKGRDKYGDNQRHAVRLIRQWNRAIEKHAIHWKKGDIFIHKTNDWFTDQFLETHLLVQDLYDASGLGRRRSPWKDIAQGCKHGQSAEHVCSDPSSHLFWDDVHLGPRATRMLADSVARDLVEHKAKWFV